MYQYAKLINSNAQVVSFLPPAVKLFAESIDNISELLPFFL